MLASCARPAIAVPGDPIALEPGASTTLHATVAGSGPLTYQWFAGAAGDTSAPLAGATSDSLEVAPTTPSRYWLRVTNACGAEDSAAIVVTMGERSRGRVVRR